MDLNTRKVSTRQVVHFDKHRKADKRGPVIHLSDDSEGENASPELMYSIPDLPPTVRPPSTDAEQEGEPEEQITRSGTTRGEESDDEAP